MAAAKLAMDRYSVSPFARIDLMSECFITYDPKDPVLKLGKPWLRNEYHDEVTREILSGEWIEVNIHKSKQTNFTWRAAGLSLAGMLTQPGYMAYLQSRKHPVAKEAVARSKYMLEHLDGPLRKVLRDDDWSWNENEGVLTIHTFLGRELRSSFTALADGAEQWRYLAASIGFIDEAAFLREFRASHAAALSACEGGGILVVQSTADLGSPFNEHVVTGIELAVKEAAGYG